MNTACWSLRGYPETGVGKRVELFDSERTFYQDRSAQLWFIEYSIESNRHYRE